MEACARCGKSAGRGADAAADRRIVAFAGIGRPEKFFETLESLSCALAGARAVADH